MLPGFLLTLAAGAVVVAVVVSSSSSAPSPSGSSTSSASSVSSSAPVSIVEDGFAFRAVQERSGAPVAWDPCRPIAVVVDDRQAPEGADALLDEALATVAEATGLRFDVEGGTDEAPSVDRSRVQPERYGDRWAPVLVAWTDPASVPELAGDVGGLGGSETAVADDGTAVYVTGTLLLDGPQMQESLRVAGGRDQVLSVLLHELGHVVGLGHVDDPAQLMHPEGQPGAAGYAAGDLAGLAHLGEGPCVAPSPDGER